MFKRNTVVLTPFPFTDLSSQKLRPAVIISAENKKTRDVIVAFITTQKTKATNMVVEINQNDKDFVKTGLKADSVICVDKIATLDKKIILGELGELSKKHADQIDLKLKKVLNLK
jgi:mRNA interferase MazF